MKGGFTVTGLVTGGWLIEDIRVSVPHGVAVFIPADDAYRSKDLWRAIQQGRVFQLTGGAGLAVEPPVSKPESKNRDVSELESENKSLRRQLGEERRQKSALQRSIEGMQAQLASISSFFGKVESGEVPLMIASPQMTAPVASLAPSQVEPNEAVGREVPNFIPDNLAPEGAKASLDVKAEVVKGTSVSDTAKLLRKARGKAAKS